MAPYSMDLRKRVLEDCDSGLMSKEVAAKFRVSRSWVDRIKQRRRERGELEPRRQRVFKKQAFAGQEDRLRAQVAAKTDQTLAELRDALRSSASLSSLWRALDRPKLTVKKNRSRRRAATP
jgi:transposase